MLAVADVKDGEAFDIYRYPAKKLRKRYGNRAEMHQAGEQPPECVLRAIAAAGGVPDWFYDTTTPSDVNP